MSKTLGQIAKQAVRDRGNFTEALTDTDWRAAAKAVEAEVRKDIDAERAVIEAARALADKNLDNVNRTTLHQAVHDHETVRALHNLVYAVRALQSLKEKK